MQPLGLMGLLHVFVNRTQGCRALSIVFRSVKKWQGPAPLGMCTSA